MSSKSWKVNGANGVTLIQRAVNGETICRMSHGAAHHESELVAAAPELQEALKDMLAAWPYMDCLVTIKARAAIAKSEGGYNRKRVAWELERVAMGDGFYGNALKVAKEICSLSDEELDVIQRYETGKQKSTDHVALQAIAMRIYEKGGAA